MKTRRVVEGPLGDEVVQDAGLVGAQPVVGIGAQDTVLGVGVRRAGRGRRVGRGAGHGGHRTAGALLAVLGLLLAVPDLRAWPTGSPAAAKEKVVFHVGMLGEGVDSLNPFLGFQAPSYEMWGLTYDYLIGYTMKDMSPAPGLATKWTTSSDGKTWTFTVRSGVKFSDGVPLTAKDVAYTYNRILHGTRRAVELAVLPQRRHQGDRAERHDRRAEAEEAQRHAPAAADPDRARARLEERQREGDQDLQGRADRRQAGRRAPGRSGWSQGTADGSTFKFEANPDYWGGTPHIDEIDFQFYKNDDSAVQALIKGEIDFVEGITAARGQEPAEPGRDHRPQRQLAGLRRDRVQRRLGVGRDRRARRSATPTRPCSTRSSGTPSATRSTCRS